VKSCVLLSTFDYPNMSQLQASSIFGDTHWEQGIGIRPCSGLREGYVGYRGHHTHRLRGERRAVQRADYSEWLRPNLAGWSVMSHDLVSFIQNCCTFRREAVATQMSMTVLMMVHRITDVCAFVDIVGI
jgi:hypothetical protein